MMKLPLAWALSGAPSEVVALLVVLLLAAAVIAMLSQRVRVPYTVALVLVGVLLGHFRCLPDVPVSADAILWIFLPPLLFEGTMAMQASLLRRHALDVTLLSFGVTGVCFVGLGWVAHAVAGLAWPVALLLAAMVSPTDPVAVLALFRELGVVRNLALLVEAESCFNDGLGVVLFTLMAGVLQGQPLSVGQALGSFVWLVFGGLVVGTALGWLVVRIVHHQDEPVVEVLWSVTLAWGAYLVAEHLQCSGVLSVVAAGLVLGNLTHDGAMRPETRLVLASFWEVVAFVANSLLFVLLGGVLVEVPPTSPLLPGATPAATLLASPGSLVLAHLPFVLLLSGAAIVLRGLTVYAIGGMLRWRGSPWPAGFAHVIAWSGLRGSIPVALLLSLGRFSSSVLDLHSREAMWAGVQGLVLGSLLVQGLTIRTLLSALGLFESTPPRADQAQAQAQSPEGTQPQG